ncbi:MAG: hypothetical protein IPH31_23770 [Lewinellaceae bacterium]|nr:hypothetical protein [Lewinellaceae bacterium]
MVKLNGAGGIQWQKTLGGSGADEAFYVKQTSDNGYIVASCSGSNDGNVSQVIMVLMMPGLLN